MTAPKAPADPRAVLSLPATATEAEVRAALETYQRAAGLDVTGELDTPTWKALRR